MNVYSNSSQSALKYLKNIEVNIHNVLVMIGDFNIRDNLWNSLYSHYLFYSDYLFEIAGSFDLGLSIPTKSLLDIQITIKT